MLLGQVFERFVKESPVCVMMRATMEWVFSPTKLNEMFSQAAELQYERELQFSVMVDLMSLVVCREAASVHAAYQQMKQQVGVSAKALYEKLKGVERPTSEALVRYTATEARKLIDHSQGTRKPLIAGFPTRILDGNHLGGTDHRLKVLRRTAAGALPGQALVLLNYEYMTVDEVILCEDGEAQERSLLKQVLPRVNRGELLISDRNFCTVGFLCGLARRQARFIIRLHGRMAIQLRGKPRFVGRCPTGRVYEQAAEITDLETGRTLRIRCITLKLYKPTRDGDTQIVLLTNLPKRIPAGRVCEAYHKRWTLEDAFHQMTTDLCCEPNTLGYPKAALFAFCVAVSCYNLLAAIKGTLRGIHGEEAIETTLSNYFLMVEIGGVYRGMMIAIPPAKWVGFQAMTDATFADQLRTWASRVDLMKYQKHSRGPKKPQPKRANAKFQHVSTFRLLAADRAARPQPRTTATADTT